MSGFGEVRAQVQRLRATHEVALVLEETQLSELSYVVLFNLRAICGRREPSSLINARHNGMTGSDLQAWVMLHHDQGVSTRSIDRSLSLSVFFLFVGKRILWSN